jgi:hypothetical protein
MALSLSAPCTAVNRSGSGRLLIDALTEEVKSARSLISSNRTNWFNPAQVVGLGRFRSVARRELDLRVKLQADYFAATGDALRPCSDSLGFEAEVNGDRNARGNGLAAPRCWFVPVFLQGFHRGLAQ